MTIPKPKKSLPVKSSIYSTPAVAQPEPEIPAKKEIPMDQAENNTTEQIQNVDTIPDTIIAEEIKNEEQLLADEIIPKVDTVPETETIVKNSTVDEAPNDKLPSDMFEESFSIPVSDYLRRMLKRLKDTSKVGLVLNLSLIKYCEEMMPGKVHTNANIIANQIKLKNILTDILKADNSYFRPTLMVALRIVFENNNNGAWSDSYIFRGAEDIALSKNQLSAFQQTINLFKEVCDPSTRSENAKRLFIDRDLAAILTDNERNRLRTTLVQ